MSYFDFLLKKTTMKDQYKNLLNFMLLNTSQKVTHLLKKTVIFKLFIIL